MSDSSRRSTAPAHDPERERLDLECDRLWDAIQVAWDAPPDIFWAAVHAYNDSIDNLAAYDQARGPTVPTRTASGYRNQAAPDE